MLIVSGSFTLDPADRDAFVAGRLDAMRTTRTEAGCLEYVLSADPVDPARVVLLERWESQEAFDAHMVAVQSAPRAVGPAPTGVSAVLYEIAGERTLA
ncbi:MAG: putative quinol monooxygenase [Actinomycetes bacterium]